MQEATLSQVVGTGAVNFDSNVVSQHEVSAIQTLEATPMQDTPTLGNVRIHSSPTSLVQPTVTVKPVNVHRVGLAFMLTLGTGLTFLKGMKDLKSVDVQLDEGSPIEKFNFYNPFVRADKDRQTGEGLLRNALGSIAKIAHSVLGKDVVYFAASETDMHDSVADLANSVLVKLLAQLKVPQDADLFDVVLTTAHGETTRPVKFSELFSISTWVSTSTDEEACVTEHTATFNISINAGAIYDSSEPHLFVRKASSFLESQLAALGIADSIDHHVNYAFDSLTLEVPEVRDLLDILINEDQYSMISKNAVETGQYNWIHPSHVYKLFGCGCDLILSSPSAAIEAEE